MKIFEFVSIPVLIASLIGGVNVLTEVTKKVVPISKAEPVVLIWAELLSVLSAFVAVWLEGAITWQVYAMAGVCGILGGAVVAYAAMFGYDDLYKRVVGVLGSVFEYMGGGNDKQQSD